ncbi:MAG TPA: CdaR family protein [Bacillaceae bacterium]|nr:CdaR family protein [Paenibacillus bovis]HLU21720.1 CdaR family protein [Bacillaceae bacterium]
MDNKMDKFMENPWFVRIIAMILTAILFFSFNGFFDKDNGTTPNDMEDENVETLTNVPVEVYYDAENLVVSGVPKTVTVRLQGQKRFLEAAKRQRDFTIFVDLSDVEIGNHRVPVQHKDISNKLQVRIDPTYVDISLQEKVTEEFKVEAEFNRSILAEGFEAQQPEIEPRTVKITGAKDIVDKITYVKATIDASGLISDTIVRQAAVTVLDRELNKLDVEVEPKTVSVEIPVKNPRKNVPIKINTTGTPPDDIVIKTVSTTTPEVLIYGRTTVLQDIDELNVSVDVSNIREDTELEVPIQYPIGVNKISPNKVVVKITAEKKVTEKTFDKIKIDTKQLEPNLNLEFLSPPSGELSLKLSGEKAKIDNVEESDFEVFVNLEDLNAGEHEVQVEVAGPEDVDWETSIKTVKVRLTEEQEEETT